MKIQFVSPLQTEIDVVALGLTFERDEIKDVSDEDGEILLRSSAFARVDDDAPKAATVTASASSTVALDAKPIVAESTPPIAATTPEPKP